MQWDQAFLAGMELRQRRQLALAELEQRKQDFALRQQAEQRIAQQAALQQEMQLAEENRRAEEFARERQQEMEMQQAMEGFRRKAGANELSNRTASRPAMMTTGVAPTGPLGAILAAATQNAPIPTGGTPGPAAYEQAVPDLISQLPAKQAIPAMINWTRYNQDDRREDAANRLAIRMAELETTKERNRIQEESAKQRRRDSIIATQSKNLWLQSDPRWGMLSVLYEQGAISDTEFARQLQEITTGKTGDAGNAGGKDTAKPTSSRPTARVSGKNDPIQW